MSDEARALLGAVPAESLLLAYDTAPVMVAVTAGPEHRLIWRNRAATEAYGQVDVGRPLRELFPELGPSALALWDRAFRGESVRLARYVVAIPDNAGRRRAMRYSLVPLSSADGTPLGVIQFIVDATLEADAEAVSARSRLSDNVSTALLAATDARSALQALTDELVPAAADLALAFVYTDAAAGGRLPEPGAPVALSLGPKLHDVGPPPPPSPRTLPTPWDETLLAGRGVVIPVPLGRAQELTDDPVAVAWLEQAAVTSVAAVPLAVAGEIAGALVVAGAGDRPVFDDGDLNLLSEITARAGAAIAEVRARERYRQIAERLQVALRPRWPPLLPGLVVAARYLAGGADDMVGGDWWDVADLGGQWVGLGIGDISGHGVAAAAFMGQVRVAMHTAASAHLPPTEVLAAVDSHLADTFYQESPDGDLHRLATALHAVVDLANGTVRIASAGHPPPLVLHPDGAVEALPVPPGPPLGLHLPPDEELTVPFGAGDTLVAFTDGLVEDRTTSIADGIDRLARVLSTAGASHGAEDLADHLLGQMGRLHGLREDDIALLVARRP